MPVVDEMMDDVESGKTWTLSHVPETITRLIRGLNEVACLVPDSFYEVRPLHTDNIKLDTYHSKGWRMSFWKSQMPGAGARIAS